MDLISILETAVRMKASDLHITVGVPIILRIHGRLQALDDNKLMPADTERFIREITSGQQWETLRTRGEVDFSYSLPGVQRFRVNAYTQRNSFAAAIRLINTSIPTIEELGLPPIVKDLTEKNSGIILVTGPTGSGKSTTLASMIEIINQTRDKHIITLEDPIEYLFRHKKSIVNQREIGTDTQNFSNALRASLRQDPDVILVGEMRDHDTISVALTAAETGHLVFSTLHTVGAAATVNRIIDIFPSSQQEQIRYQLSMTLQAVISQQLITRTDGMGRVAAFEVMVANPAIRNMIRESKIHQINNVLQTNVAKGMKTMDDALINLYRKGLISKTDVLERCVDLDYIRNLTM
ncbi:MAG: type IV pilus twitching motility protein PilT [Clostridiales bacterium]|nr:type IV pilus twitching motility protein PilT [Clostridiales bacterium]